VSPFNVTAPFVNTAFPGRPGFPAWRDLRRFPEAATRQLGKGAAEADSLPRSQGPRHGQDIVVNGFRRSHIGIIASRHRLPRHRPGAGTRTDVQTPGTPAEPAEPREHSQESRAARVSEPRTGIDARYGRRWVVTGVSGRPQNSRACVLIILGLVVMIVLVFIVGSICTSGAAA